MPKKDADPFSSFQLADGRWRAVAQTRDQTGRLRPKTFERQTEQEVRLAMREHLRTHLRLNPSPGMTVAAMLDAFQVRCERKGRAPTTLRKYDRYRRMLTPLLGHLTVSKLMPFHVEQAIETFEGDADALSARNYLRAAINKVARKADPTLGNVAGLAEPPVYRPLTRKGITEADVSRLLQREPDVRLRALWTLYAGTGIRPVEGRTLAWPEIQERPDGMWIAKLQAKTPEGKRPVPVPPSVAEVLRSLPKTSVFVFPIGKRGGSPSEGFVRERWIDAIARADIDPDVTLYQLRHLFGTIMARRHKDHVLMRLMRHRNVNTTKQYYVDEHDDELRKAVDG